MNRSTDEKLALVRLADRFVDIYSRLAHDSSDSPDYRAVWASFQRDVGGLAALGQRLTELVQGFEGASSVTYPRCATCSLTLLEKIWTFQTLGERFWSVAQRSVLDNYSLADAILDVKLRELWLELLESVQTTIDELVPFVDDHYKDRRNN